IVVFCLSVAQGTAAQTLTITSPSPGQRLQAGPDYATDVLDDPWDMSNPEDISQYPDERAGWGSDFGFNNGLVGGTTVPVSGFADTSLSLLYRGFHGVVNTGRTGWRFPIDPTIYRKLSLRLISGVAQAPQVYWFHQRHGDPAPGGITGSGDGAAILPLYDAGANIYEMDLTQVPPNGEAWNASLVLGLRIDANSSATGHQAFIDWVRLTRGDSDTLAARHTITWSGGSGSTTIQVIDASGTTLTVAAGLSSSTTQYVWRYGTLPPGTYTLRVTRGGTTATRTFSINAPPIAHVTDPDETGGPDFATAVLGNPWDMNDSADVARTGNLTSASFSGGQFHGTSNTTGDPSVWLLDGFASPRPIDTSRYRYLTVLFQVDASFSLGGGSVARVFWGSNQAQSNLLTTSSDIIVWPGLNTYTVDLGSLAAGADTGIVPGATQTAWAAANVYHFRFDPFELSQSVSFHLHDVKLAAADETSGGTFIIRFSGTDADAGDAPTVFLYYDTDTNATNGRTLIASAIPLSAGSYSWNTSFVAPGTYYIYAEVTDGINTTSRYSTGRVRVLPANAGTLSVVVRGSGTVVSSPAGINCGTECSKAFGAGAVVALTPIPAGASVFSGWSGGEDCLDGVITMTGDTPCTANFVPALGIGPTRGAIDLNGDSGADSFRYNSASGAWAMDFSDRAGAFNTRTGSWAAGWMVRAADFDGNALTDFFLYNPQNGKWSKAINTSDAGFTYFTSTWSPGWTPLVVDLNADGKSDVFLYNTTNGQWFKCISLGTGTGEFAYVSGYWSPGWEVYPVDFNGDGAADVFLYNRSTGQWFRATNDLGAGFSYAMEYWSAGW
ncbi:MAG: VCBS repeat-containing protein, partial [Acidobacteria bacterium]|nr:VCBS repeat-containing protein [Acidobacteriota bacterium]